MVLTERMKVQERQWNMKQIFNNLRAILTRHKENMPVVTVAEMLAEIDEEEAKFGGGWIPCSSGQMPEDGENVLIWFEYFRYGDFSALYQRYGIGFVWNGKWSRFVNDTSGWQKLRIIAWQPLPTPYQKGE